ncbi:DUF1929 domain-containing protein [Phyllobacterium sp. 628]|uniref:hypothetical protein n=1 Tax=Phyllobacterium sp. 628 TaxID=2718938 RepID=UPI0016628AD1|nr:hypothetical protein [Phyllobacterium sp. 628]QND52305.1 DUF1929 domain-containing protein [Phyllobacterium sp. 628]
MRATLLVQCVCFSALLIQPTWAENSKGYQLTIDGKQVGIDVGDTLTVTTSDGKDIKVTLDRSKFVTASSEFVSFDHAGNLSVVKSDLGGGISQYLLNTALGTMVIVQEYKGMDPSSLSHLMIQQLTKESKQAGAKVEEIPTERQIDSGKKLKGLKATVNSKYDTINIEAVTYGNPDQGIIVVTQIDQENETTDGPMIDTFWKSLNINF